MSESAKWNRIGREMGEALARGIESAMGPTIRKYLADTFGVCRVCEAPLGGESPEKICEPCHAAELLAAGLGGSAGGEA